MSLDTVLEVRNVERRKLVNGVWAFFQMYKEGTYRAEFEKICASACGGVADEILDDVEVMLNGLWE